MKLWIDDIRPAPEGYDHLFSVNEAKSEIIHSEESIKAMKAMVETYEIATGETWCSMREEIVRRTIELIDIDHDAGDEANDGGDYIRLLDWLEETNRSYPIRIHSMNPVGVANMRRIIQRNGWTEVK